MEPELAIRAVEDAYRLGAPPGTEITVEQAIVLGSTVAVHAMWHGHGAQLGALEVWEVADDATATRRPGFTDLVVLANRLHSAPDRRDQP
jgi:hypothetical protein